MIEFRTQYLTEVVLTLETGESINSFLHLCPWNDEAGTMYLIEKAGIVSTTTQMEPRILSFTDNGRTSGSDLNGFVFYASREKTATAKKIGVIRNLQ